MGNPYKTKVKRYIQKKPKEKKGSKYTSGVLKGHKRGHYLYDAPPE